MKRPIVRRAICPLILASNPCLWLLMAGTSEAKAPTAQELREVLKRQWESLESFEFTCEAFDLKNGESQKGVKGYGRYHFAMGPGGCRSVTLTNIKPDGSEEVAEEMFEDGKKRYVPDWNSKVPKELKSVEIITTLDQTNTRDKYEGLMPLPLTMFMPYGRPLYTWLDDPINFTVRTEDGKEIVAFDFNERNNTVHCELDGSHDWLPVRLAVDKVYETKVTRFEKDNGRWFPAAGEYKILDPEYENQSVFTVSGIRINRPFPANTFNPISLAIKGTMIDDKAKKMARVVGGGEARVIQRLKASKEASAVDLAPVVAVEPGGKDPRLFYGGAFVLLCYLLYAYSRSTYRFRKS